MATDRQRPTVKFHRLTIRRACSLKAVHDLGRLPILALEDCALEIVLRGKPRVDKQLYRRLSPRIHARAAACAFGHYVNPLNRSLEQLYCECYAEVKKESEFREPGAWSP